MSGFPLTPGAVRRLLGGGGVQVVGAGDSLMSGLTAPNTVTILAALAAYSASLSKATYTNDGVAGSRLDTTITGGAASGADVVVRYAANIYPKRPAATGAPRSDLHLLIGANEFGVMTAAQTVTWCATYNAYAAQARADGFTVIGYTIPPRLDTVANKSGSFNENRLIMNDAIRRSRNVDAVVDLAAMFSDDDMAAGVYVLPDKIHFNDAGNRLIARAAASAVAALGAPQVGALPASSAAPALERGLSARLERASLTLDSAAGNNPRLRAALAAFGGAGDFTVAWCQYWKTGDTANSSMLLDATLGTIFGVIFTGAAGNETGQIYSTPGANWSDKRVLPNCWNHIMIRRASGVMDYILNGKVITSFANAENFLGLDRLSGATKKFGRVRVFSRALTDAEVLYEYRSMSEFRAQETYALALEDGDEGAGQCLLDKSGNGNHLMLASESHKRTTPARRGMIQWTAVGSEAPSPILPTFPAAAVRIAAWTADVTVAGGGAVNIGHTNNGGQYFNAVLGVGKNDLALLSRYPGGASVYVNATGFTIKHTVTFEYL